LKYKGQDIDFGYIQNLINQKTPEQPDLEFKSKAEFLNYKTDSNTFGLCVSAMANSGGGLVIYGVKTRRDDKLKIDLADATDPFELVKDNISLQTFNDRLKARIDPQILELETDFIKDSNNDNLGFFVVVVPDSSLSPHMFFVKDSLKESNKYYFRDNFGNSVPMRHHDIQLRMRAQKESPLGIFVSSTFINSGYFDLFFQLMNSGRAIVEDVMIRIYFCSDDSKMPYARTDRLKGPFGKVEIFTIREKDTFFPNVMMPIPHVAFMTQWCIEILKMLN